MSSLKINHNHIWQCSLLVLNVQFSFQLIIKPVYVELWFKLNRQGICITCWVWFVSPEWWIIYNIWVQKQAAGCLDVINRRNSWISSWFIWSNQYKLGPNVILNTHLNRVFLPLNFCPDKVCGFTFLKKKREFYKYIQGVSFSSKMFETASIKKLLVVSKESIKYSLLQEFSLCWNSVFLYVMIPTHATVLCQI